MPHEGISHLPFTTPAPRGNESAAVVGLHLLFSTRQHIVSILAAFFPWKRRSPAAI
jgi:hypothetical protein